MIVEADDGADELPQLHKVGRDDVDAVLPGPLRSDPLHHPGQGPGRNTGGEGRDRCGCLSEKSQTFQTPSNCSMLLEKLVANTPRSLMFHPWNGI